MERPSPRFRSEEYFVCELSEGNVINRGLCGRHAGAHPDGYQHGSRKKTETSAAVFCNKSMNLSLKELINIKVILFTFV